jgi:hypothetical protein
MTSNKASFTSGAGSMVRDIMEIFMMVIGTRNIQMLPFQKQSRARLLQERRSQKIMRISSIIIRLTLGTGVE